MAVNKTVPQPAPEAEVETPEVEAPEAPAAPAQRYFRSVLGITDGAQHYAANVVFVGTDGILAHHERTRGYDGRRLLYVEVPQHEYETYEAERLAAIQDVELPEPAAVNQVTPNQTTWGELPPPGPAPVAARPGGAGFSTLDGGMAGSAGSA